MKKWMGSINPIQTGKKVRVGIYLSNSKCGFTAGVWIVICTATIVYVVFYGLDSYHFTVSLITVESVLT